MNLFYPAGCQMCRDWSSTDFTAGGTFSGSRMHQEFRTAALWFQSVTVAGSLRTMCNFCFSFAVHTTFGPLAEYCL